MYVNICIHVYMCVYAYICVCMDVYATNSRYTVNVTLIVGRSRPVCPDSTLCSNKDSIDIEGHSTPSTIP